MLFSSSVLMDLWRMILRLIDCGRGCFDRLVIVLMACICPLCSSYSDHEELGLLCGRFKEKKQTLWERLISEFNFQEVRGSILLPIHLPYSMLPRWWFLLFSLEVTPVSF